MKKLTPLAAGIATSAAVAPTVLGSCSCSVCFIQHNFISDGKYSRYESSVESSGRQTFDSLDKLTTFYVESAKKDPLIIANDLMLSNDLGESVITPSIFEKYFIKVTVNEIDPTENRISYTFHAELSRDDGKTQIVSTEQYNNIKSKIVKEGDSYKLICAYDSYEAFAADDKFSVNVAFKKTSTVVEPLDIHTNGTVTNKSGAEDLAKAYEYVSEYFRIDPSDYLKDCKVNN